MNGITQVLDKLAGASGADSRPGDFIREGLVHCGVCGKPREHLLTLPNGETRKVRAVCECQSRREQQALQERKQQEFADELLRRRTADRISDGSHLRHRFEADDGQDPQAAGICRSYAEKWEQMRANNIGVLFYGTVGSGKTFLAGCIVNALCDRQVFATVTGFPRLLNLLQNSADRQGLLDRLNGYDCLVIDDLGAERDSPYALEQVYNIIDSRGKTGKPLIVTTNLTLQELKNPPGLAYARIYDRVLELCPITLKLTGASRRTEHARSKRELAKQLLTESY